MPPPKRETISFSFGKNWLSYVEHADEDSIQQAVEDIQNWIGGDSVVGKRIVDVGCGSGIHSLAFWRLGASEVVSFDFDPFSVTATHKMWQKAGSPEQWKIMQGSVLDPSFLKKLGNFDLVYSWGVLHHTGAMWKAIELAGQLVRANGLFWIALYVKGPSYARHLKTKQRYNKGPEIARKLLILKEILRILRWRLRDYSPRVLARRLLRGNLTNWPNPFAWNEPRDRGMDAYHDIIDWLGGLPYEVAGADEVVDFLRQRGFWLVKIKAFPRERMCNIYLFARVSPGAS